MSCSCSRHRTGYGGCVSCGNRTSTIRSEDMPYSLNTENGRFGSGAVLQCIPRWVFCVISTALMTFFAFAGAFAGAIAGAVAGRASDSGVFRGAGLGAIAGAILTLEVLEASRAYWCLEQSGSRSASSMADFIEELLRGRFVEEQFTPAMLTAYRWQVSIANVSYDEIRDIYGGVAYRGLSSDSLKKLPCHVIKDDIKAGQSICCTICLQDIVSGETVRSLPRCRHSFHLTCVDKWLIRHGSCPICRQSM